MLNVGDKVNEKGEEIFEWRKCTDPDHANKELVDFYVTTKERDFYIEKDFKMPIRCYSCRSRRRRQAELRDNRQSNKW